MQDRDKTKEQLISELVEIRETKDFLDNIIDSSLDSIIITDAKGCITRTNRSFLQMLDCEKKRYQASIWVSYHHKKREFMSLLLGNLWR